MTDVNLSIMIKDNKGNDLIDEQRGSTGTFKANIYHDNRGLVMKFVN
jgi:hypothetical protein